MSPETQQTKIAEVCGWARIHWSCGQLVGQIGAIQYYEPIPSYFNDQNAIHDAEKTIGLHNRENTPLRVKWVNSLRDIVSRDCPKNKAGAAMCSDIDLLLATAGQRCEALLRTLNKWENEQKV